MLLWLEFTDLPLAGTWYIEKFHQASRVYIPQSYMGFVLGAQIAH
jgi:hypothetical protein